MKNLIESKCVILHNEEVEIILDFIDTDLYNKAEIIKVLIYSDETNRAKRQALKLVEGEKIIEHKEYIAGMKVLVEKNGQKIIVMTAQLDEGARGCRTTYSFIDSNIFNHKYASELFKCVIVPANVVYGHILSEDKIKSNARYILF